MKIYFLGIGGTFMGNLALLARAMGHQVGGCDQNIYPPMSNILQDAEIVIDIGYQVECLPRADIYVIGNALSRGNPLIEHILTHNLPMTSGPAWLSEHLLQTRHVIAVAGTHGKTTTSTMIAWILQSVGLEPGYIIGGVPQGFAQSAALGKSQYFVMEADEYDTAFFDKRSKFIHYKPSTLIINNLEFDHADIFDDIDDIKKTFHHLLKIIPANGQVISQYNDQSVHSVLQQGCWSEQFSIACHPSIHDQWLTFKSVDLQSRPIQQDWSEIEFLYANEAIKIHWQHIGYHNLCNATAAVAAALHVGVSLTNAVQALSDFQGVKRRMELRFEKAGVKVYDDFAHHPTALALAIQGLRDKVGQEKIVAIIEPRSNTMAMGVHEHTLSLAVEHADEVVWLDSDRLGFNLQAAVGDQTVKDSVEEIVNSLIEDLKSKSKVKPNRPVHWLCMSNGAFGQIFDLMEQALTEFAATSNQVIAH